MEITGASAAALSLAAIPAPEGVPPAQAAANRSLIQAVKTVNESGTLGENEMTFQIDRNSHLPIVQIVDRSTKKVVEQIPPEYLLQLAQTLGQKSSFNTLSTLA
jgi:flagellar protein FlaG